MKKFTEADIDAMADEAFDHWLGIGLKTDPIDFAEAQIKVQRLISLLLEDSVPARDVIYAASPRAIEGHVGSWWNQLGRGDEGWAAFYRAAHIILGDEADPIQDAQDAVLESCFGLFVGDLLYVMERPCVLTFDRQGRLHGDGQPAIAWADGARYNYWHDTELPDDFWTWNQDDAFASDNAEHRRAWFEVDSSRWALIEDRSELLDECADPGNGNNRLRLYRVPRDIISDRVLLLRMVNGSPNADGSTREYAELIDDRFTSALAASASGYGLSVDEYAALEVRR